MGGKAEIGYIEAWKKNTSAPRPRKVPVYSGPLRADQHPAHVQRDKALQYHIRLDTPGGYTHAPDSLSPHNMEKRLFLPNREYASSQGKDYDYDAEIRAVRAQRLKEKHQARKHSPFALGDIEDKEDQEAIRGLVSTNVAIDPNEPTEAQRYAATIALTQGQLTAESKPNQATGTSETEATDEDKGKGKSGQEAGDVDLSELISFDDNPAPAQGDAEGKATGTKPATARFADTNEVREYEPEEEHESEDGADRYSLGGSSYAPASLALSNATGRSTSSMMSQMSVSEVQSAKLKDEDGNLMRAALKSELKRGAITPGIVPQKQVPSKSNPKMSQTPWKNTIEYSTHPKFERPTQIELNRGFTRFEEQSGKGAVPSLGELNGKIYSDTDTLRSVGVSQDPHFDRRTFASSTAVTDKMSLAQLRPKDLFMPDPRPFRPLRYVRRSDPRQIFLCCAGACLSATQAASMQAAKLAHDAGVSELTPELQSAMEHTVQQIKMGYTDADAKAGIGMLYCPQIDPWLEMVESGDAASLWTTSTSGSKSVFAAQGTPGRVEDNLSRRLEKPSEYSRTTLHRAQLRAVCAALEYNQWEMEGFNQIVIAVSQRWIVRGISEQIFAWKSNGFKLTGAAPEVFDVLGQPQEDVPDQDLWLLLSNLVKKYEAVDCTVRFWYLPPDSCKEMRMANKLALDGALKTKQQPMTVKWKRKDNGRKYFQLDEEKMALINKAAKGDDHASLASGASQASAVTIKKMNKAENGPSITTIVARERQDKEMNAHMPKDLRQLQPAPTQGSTASRPVPPPPLPDRPEPHGSVLEADLVA